MIRKILYSPGYGAGWTTWNSDEVAKFLLTYQPIIDFLEAGKRFSNKDVEDKTLHPLLKRLRAECKKKFGAQHICVLGADDLKVASVSGGVRIFEYDGFEALEEEGTYEGWL